MISLTLAEIKASHVGERKRKDVNTKNNNKNNKNKKNYIENNQSQAFTRKDVTRMTK